MNISGKLVRCLVKNGEHVEKGAAYAEVEVMKMMMPLLSPAAGVITFQASEGAPLVAGELIGNLELVGGVCILSWAWLGRAGLCLPLLVSIFQGLFSQNDTTELNRKLNRTHKPNATPPQDDANAVTRAVDFTGSFPELGPPQVYSDRVDHRFTQALHAAKMIMAGGWRRRCFFGGWPNRLPARAVHLALPTESQPTPTATRRF